MICIKEVGVDLELCVHAHENDVDRLGSFLQNDYPAVWFFRYSWIDSLQLWFRPRCPDLIYLMGIHSSASSIFGKVEVSTIIAMTRFYFYHVLPSSITPWYLEDINPLHFILWNSDEVVPFPVIVTPRVLGCRQPWTPICESNQHWDSALPVLCCWEV